MITAIASLYRLACSGLTANQARLDVIADNIANSNTAAFKSNRTLFSEALDPTAEPPDEEGLVRYQGVRVLEISPDLAQGVVVPSESPWHLAIDGPGFFQVRLADGTLAYTRDGQFRIDRNAHLVTATGALLDPAITVPAEALTFAVNADGTIIGLFETTDQATGRTIVETRELGRVATVGFVNPEGLLRIGNSMFVPSEASGPALTQRPNGQPWGELIGGAIESSNTRLVDAMTDMVVAQRAYALSARVLQTIDEAAEFANQLLR